MVRRLDDIERDIEAWILRSQSTFTSNYRSTDGRVWVLKFFAPKYLEGFMGQRQMVISTTPGFTWGDGVYVVPLRHVYSAMLYGRIGVMGWIDPVELKRVYDAGGLAGLDYYQEWIQFKPSLFRLLTTTIHAQHANRQLRNAFRQRFKIDLMFFRPDEFNRAYVQPALDRWFTLSEFPSRGIHAGGSVGYSTKVQDCELVALGTEEFEVERPGFQRRDLIGRHFSPLSRSGLAAGRPNLSARLELQYQQNRARGANPPGCILLRP